MFWDKKLPILVTAVVHSELKMGKVAYSSWHKLRRSRGISTRVKYAKFMILQTCTCFKILAVEIV